MNVTDTQELLDGKKYRVVTISYLDLQTVYALHLGMLEKGKDSLAKDLQEKLASAKNFNEIQDLFKASVKALAGAESITKLLESMSKQMEKYEPTTAARMLLTVEELEYFHKLTSLPVNRAKAADAGFTDDLIEKADAVISSARAALEANEAPTEKDVQILITKNLQLAGGNIFNTPVGKA